MKQLKFTQILADTIKNKSRNSTWVLFDTDNLSQGDEVLFIQTPEHIPFAKAKLTRVFEKKYNELSSVEKEDHEKFDTKHGIYKTYTSYKGIPVIGESTVKIIKFEVIEWI